MKALRRVTRTSQKELGKFCGVSDVAVGYWEKDVNIPKGRAAEAAYRTAGELEFNPERYGKNTSPSDQK
ncbi:Cro/CI family transcriptional regulator [Escherichia coli]